MPSQDSQLISRLLLAFGVPGAVALLRPDLASPHNALSVVFAAGWLLTIMSFGAFRKALARPFNRRVGQAVDSLDEAVSRKFSGYESRYRQWVRDSHCFIDVKGLATAGDHTPRLDEVYVNVALVSVAPHRVSGDPLGRLNAGDGRRQTIGEILRPAHSAVLAVIGPPGCGKTTLLAHLALTRADGSARKGQVLPVMLVLRDHAADIAQAPDIALPQIVRKAVRLCPGTEPMGWWDRQLEHGCCLVLLDGLDEIANEQDRRIVADWIERQIDRFPGNQYVVTSRPHGYRSAIIRQASITTLCPFTEEEAQRFLRGWYLATERQATGARREEMTAVRIRAAAAASELIERIAAMPALHDLIANPLLLTMIANVHRYRGSLPESRADLYGEICLVMLSRRIQAKNLPERLPWPVKKNLLSRLAYEMMDSRTRDIEAYALIESLTLQLSRSSYRLTAQDVLEDLSGHGFVIEREHASYSFVHFTFQEYLAAQYIRDYGSVKILAERVDDDWWREATLLYAATGDVDPIVEACLKSGTNAALTLAVECSIAGHELKPELRRRLEQVQMAAFEGSTDATHRKLVAGILASRLSRNMITTSRGTHVCSRLVPSALYWLFLEETKSPDPDVPCLATLDDSIPALGMRGPAALAFVDWLNGVLPEFVKVRFRLPTIQELDDLGVRESLGVRAAESGSVVTCLWVQSQQETGAVGAWIPPGRTNPHLISSGDLLDAVSQDVASTALLLPLTNSMIANMRALATDLSRPDTTSVAALSGAGINFDQRLVRRLGDDLLRDLGLEVERAREIANSRGEDLVEALAHARSVGANPDLCVDLGLRQEGVISWDRLMQGVVLLRTRRSLARALGEEGGILQQARELAAGLGSRSRPERDLAGDQVSSRAYSGVPSLVPAVGLADEVRKALDRALSYDLAEVARARDLINALISAIIRARGAASGADFASELAADIAKVLARARRLAGDLELAAEFDWVRDTAIAHVLRVSLGGPLGSALHRTVACSPDPADAVQAAERRFAGALLSAARIRNGASIEASLDGSLIAMLRNARRGMLPQGRPGSEWRPDWVSERVSGLAARILCQKEAWSKGDASRLRIGALALSDGGSGIEDPFCILAATITLIEQRLENVVPIGEAIALAIT